MTATKVKINDLTPDSTLVSGDEFIFQETGGGTTKKITTSNLITALGINTKADLASPTFTGTVTLPTSIIINGTTLTATATELNTLDGVTASTAELNILDGVTSTTAELNILDGVTSTTAELNILDGVTATAAELNYLDISTLGTSEASKVVTADANGVVGLADGVTENSETVTSSSNAVTCNMQTGTFFKHVLTENTTFTFSNPASSGSVTSFVLRLVQDASASGYSVTWPASVDWAGTTAPTLTATADAVDVFTFYTDDGGTTWYGVVVAQDLS